MNEFVNHANHNHEFHDRICSLYSDHFYDWKITCLFYIAIHYLKALADHRGKNIGVYHYEINRNIKSGTHNPTMPISNTAYSNYMSLFHYSQTARYDGFNDINIFNELMKNDYSHALNCFDQFKKFIVSSGVSLK